MSWVLWVMLQWTWKYRYLFESVFSSPWDKYSEEELLEYMAVLLLIFWETSLLFSQWLREFIIPPIVHKGSLFSTSLSTLVIFCLFDNSHSVRWYIIVAWICISLMTNDLEHIFHLPVDHLYVFFGKKNVYSDPLPILNQFFCFELYEFFIYFRH